MKAQFVGNGFYARLRLQQALPGITHAALLLESMERLMVVLEKQPVEMT